VRNDFSLVKGISMPNIIGQTIDRYQILEQLGQGGMATVYLAYDLRLDRKVAVKVIRRDVFPPVVLEKVLKRFEREAKALAKLNHPNIVAIIDYGSYNGSPYLVMPFIPSGTLKDKLGKPISFREAARTLAPLARALAYAHDQEIIHRDVKPSNILITQSGDPVLTDFGVAKLLEEVDGNTLTGTGLGLGTPEYMAPEQWQGKANARSDQYALGVMFYEMVTGQKPFTADTPIAIMLKQLNEPLPNLRQFSADLPEEVEISVLKMMAKDPKNRYPNMNAVANMLEKVATQQLPIREETRYFEDVSDQEDEQTRDDQSLRPESGSETSPEKVPVDLKTDVYPDETIDQVESPTHKPIPERMEKGFPEDQQSSAPGRIYNWNSVVKKWGGIGVGLITLTIVVVTIILSSQSKNFSPVPTDTNMGSVLEESSSSATPEPINSPTNTLIPTLSFTPSPTLGIGSIRISEIDGMEMVYVPKGNFMMGSDHPDARTDEQPIHEVFLDSFWIDKYEVTNAQYRECVNSGQCEPPTKHTYFLDEQFYDHPVVEVNWFNAQSYCDWVKRELPTEAQWEKAARGTDGRIYPWGDITPNSTILNHSNANGTTVVGSYESGVSPYGAYDMGGNVWEWVSDWYEENYYEFSPVTNPQGPEIGTQKVLRGGSWFSLGKIVYSSYRYKLDPNRSFVIYAVGMLDQRLSEYGFRCVLNE